MFSVSNRSTQYRIILLACACSISIGSHYGQHFLGPIKPLLTQEMGTSEHAFASLVSSMYVVNTITPLLSFVIPKYGANISGIVATNAVAIGLVLTFFMELASSVRGMIAGFFIFGLGVSPLSVVQETIIITKFKSHGVGLATAVGLLLGKGSSWVASVVSLPLALHFSLSAPFFLSVLAGLVSVFGCLTYVKLDKSYSQRLIVNDEQDDGQEDHLEHADQLHNKKHIVSLRELANFGDGFWIYIAYCCLSGGLWVPFVHLSSYMLLNLFDISRTVASTAASSLLFFPLVLYPTVGILLDHLPPNGLSYLLFISSSLTMVTIIILLSESVRDTLGPFVSLLPFALSYGFNPLLLVLSAARIVPTENVSIALGAHKAIENSGSTLIQSLVGVLLETSKHIKSPDNDNDNDNYQVQQRIYRMLKVFFILNVIHMVCVFLLARSFRHDISSSYSQQQPQEEAQNHHTNVGYVALNNDDDVDEYDQHVNVNRVEQQDRRQGQTLEYTTISNKHVQRRGYISIVISILVIILSWLCYFIVNANL